MELRDYLEVPQCESCAESGQEAVATTRSDNPDWAGYKLCEECAAEYNQRPPLYAEGDSI